ncbi:MAG: PIN domain-containing protein [Methylococcales bacterium]|nr:PIN domain-containing protein [Methylococcales bacterium]
MQALGTTPKFSAEQRLDLFARINEFASVASRKLGMSYAEIREYLVTLRAICDVRPLTVETHLLGLDMAERYGFSFYDSVIVSSALLSDCTTLYSEDMQHGQKKALAERVT